MKSYLDLLERVLDTGEEREDRTGYGTLSLFGDTLTHDLSEGFPLLTTKRVYWKGVVEELLWMLRGETNIRDLQDRNVHIWDQWADSRGDLGPVYGAAWRDFEGVDQISELIDNLKELPFSRRHVVSAWNTPRLPNERWSPEINVEMGNMALAPCHCLFQFYVSSSDNRLDCILYQRSADLFIGVPFNIASYALLTHIIAKQVEMVPGVLKVFFGDLHLYLNHIEDGSVKEQLSRDCRKLPHLEDFPVKPVDSYVFEDFKLSGYDPHKAIKTEVAY